MQMKALHSFEMTGTTRPLTQHHIPEDLNPQDTGSQEATGMDMDLVKFLEKISEWWQFNFHSKYEVDDNMHKYVEN